MNTFYSIRGYRHLFRELVMVILWRREGLQILLQVLDLTAHLFYALLNRLCRNCCGQEGKVNVHTDGHSICFFHLNKSPTVNNMYMYDPYECKL